jgi:photosystem II stability/assembly factor-like uncharacterized protein
MALEESLMQSKKGTAMAALFLLSLFAPSCRKPRGEQARAPQTEPGAVKTAHWEVAYRSPKSVNQPEPWMWSYNSISVVSPSLVFVAADYPNPKDIEKRVGLIVRTADGGATWTEVPLEIPGVDLTILSSIKFASSTVGWAAGVDESGHTIVFKTSDGGQTWTGKKTPFVQNATSVLFIDNDKGWIGGMKAPPDDPDGEGGPSDILFSSDGGSMWSAQYRLPVSITDLSFVNERDGWAAGIPASIYHTSDGGRTWGPQQTGLEGRAPGTSANQFRIQRVDFVDGLHGWACAANSAVNPDEKSSAVFGSTNGGATWGTLWVLQGEIFRELHFLNQQEGWAATDNGQYIYHTTDSGHRWLAEEIKSLEQRLTFYRIGAADASHVWAVGGGAIIRRVEDEQGSGVSGQR